MKTALSALSWLLVLFGAIWFLQGINVLPGSFMSGDIRWAFYGGVAMTVGLGSIFAANRRRGKKK